MDVILFFLILSIIIVATWEDRKNMIISDSISIILLLINLFFTIIHQTFIYSIISLLITIPAGMILFKYKIIGGGDIKFLIAFYTGSFLIWQNPIIQNIFFLLLAFFIAHVYVIIRFNITNEEKIRFPFMPCLLYSYLITFILFFL